MSGVVYSNTVVARNGLGQFIRDCEQAAGATVRDFVEEGASVAATMAPRRSGQLASSIKPFMLTATSGVWGSNVKYAAAQEFGAGPHDISAHVKFFWDKAGRMWMYPETYERVTGFPGADPIHHPGNPATHFMKHSWEVMKPRFTALAKKHYPG
jgi:hypothetical protein